MLKQGRTRIKYFYFLANQNCSWWIVNVCSWYKIWGQMHCSWHNPVLTGNFISFNNQAHFAHIIHISFLTVQIPQVKLLMFCYVTLSYMNYGNFYWFVYLTTTTVLMILLKTMQLAVFRNSCIIYVSLVDIFLKSA